jgi:hypothetical protein
MSLCLGINGFSDPIILLGRKPLVTLRDAALYITKLPKAEHDAEEWQAAMQALLLVAEHDGPTMFARLARCERCKGISPKTAQHRAEKQTELTNSFDDQGCERDTPLLDAFKSPFRLGCLTCNVGRSS